MNLTVCDSDSKTALLTINDRKVKLKVNRNWSPETREKVVKRVSNIAKQVLQRNIKYSVSAELSPDSMNNPVTLRSKSNKEIRIS